MQQCIELTDTKLSFCFLIFFHTGSLSFYLFLLFDCSKNSYSNIYIRTGCVDSGGETPDLISNSEVKSSSAEGSAGGTWCENRNMHPLL